MLRLSLAAAAFAVVLAGCSHGPQPPGDVGVCYHLAAFEAGRPKFNVVARNVPDLEHCAAQLEAMRLRFLRFGVGQEDITGAYQGAFLFLGPQGVFTSQSYDGAQYPFLVRTPDGRLVPPGSQ
ncbi:MAG TPA: hypothetical protein VMU93_01715 [Caulobacteraceae bacterium]|nr:hypothetical protein [Caulobacteraceae bacterium]